MDSGIGRRRRIAEAAGFRSAPQGIEDACADFVETSIQNLGVALAHQLRIRITYSNACTLFIKTALDDMQEVDPALTVAWLEGMLEAQRENAAGRHGSPAWLAATDRATEAGAKLGVIELALVAKERGEPETRPDA
jgi:hypothetical protein